mmetsp:Transcript_4480/g.5177  ORF Transcript_4480/g.5177 Transcript_4480/m.5177 type:complete len:306 (+) Transcript_4480:181-1098(+)
MADSAAVEEEVAANSAGVAEEVAVKLNDEESAGASEHEDVQAEKKNCLQKYWKGLLVVACIASLGVLASTVFQDDLIQAIRWFNDNGKGAVIYAFFFVGGIIIGIPATILELGAAIIFEEIYITIIVCTIAKNTGNIIMFFIGLKCLRGWVERNMLVPENIMMRALARVVEQKPLRYATMWGFAYVPIWTKNYGLPVLGCPLLQFVIAGNVSGIPYTVLWALIGNTARDAILSTEGESNDTLDTSQLVITIVGILVLFATISVVGYYARKAINELKEEEAKYEEEHPESVHELVEKIESIHQPSI